MEEQNPASPEAKNVGGPIMDSPKKKKNVPKIIIGAVIAVLLFGGGFALLKDAAFSGSTISSSDLVEETAEGITFKRPGSWTKIESEDADIAYTEDGKSQDEADQGLLISTESLGANYNELTAEQKTFLGDQFKQEFSDPESLKSGNCEEIADIVTNEAPKQGYDTSFTVEAVCTKFTGRAAQATIKMVIGVKDTELHLAALVALSETWDKSGAALNEILDSFRPAN